MTTLFRGTTNGGSNRVFVKDDDLKISGQGVGGSQSLDAQLIADIWSGSLVESATLIEGASPNDINDATISVEQTGGAGFVYDQLAEIGVPTFNFGPSQNQTPGISEGLVEDRLTDLEEALSRASIREDADGNFELRFSGAGVSGSLNTNADFETEDDAEAFLQNLQDGFAKGDTWSVIVEDDDLDGAFVFDFDKSWYRDVNTKKIETALQSSDVETDGSIDSRAEGAAANLALFLEQMANSGDDFVIENLAEISVPTFNFDPSQNETPGVSESLVAGRLTNLDDALSGAQIREDADGFFELRFSGKGVGGHLNTNADFASAEDAQNYLDMLTEASGGFLDDALF